MCAAGQLQAERLKSSELERKVNATGKRPAAATTGKADAATLQEKIALLQREVERVKAACDEQLLTKDGTMLLVFGYSGLLVLCFTVTRGVASMPRPVESEQIGV